MSLLSLFRYDIIYIKVRHKWFGRQLSLLENEIEETVWLSTSGLFSCPNQKASFQLEVNHFAAMIMVATSMPKEIINDNTLNVLILITANPRVDQQRLDPFRGLKFNIVLSIIKVNRLEVPNSHLGEQQEPFSFCNRIHNCVLIMLQYS